MTTLSSITRVLELQRGAYGLLLWLGERAQNDNSILGDDNLEKWRAADSTQEWLRLFVGMMPADLRPQEADFSAFARLFSSFFSTSFHISETSNERIVPGYYWQERRRSLVAGAPSTGKKSAKGKARVKEGARELERLALEHLALEGELFPSRAELDAILSDEKLEADVTLWAYFHELERRLSFASQGASVHRLWRDLSERERKNLSAAHIWEARERLLVALRKDD